MLNVRAFLNGLKLTLRQFFAKPVTMQYPEEKWDFPERFRGRLELLNDAAGKPLCVACGLCEKICPCSCITVTPATGAAGSREMAHYSLNLLRCSFCGLCVEACPVEAIRMGQGYELACPSKKDLVLQEDVLQNQNININGDA